MESTGHSAPGHWIGNSPPRSRADHPVVNISWLDAAAFCSWAGVQIPNEAQWEKAARGCDFRQFPWGDTRPECYLCNFAGCHEDTTSVLASIHGSSPYGCVDMAGNVWEWTNSYWSATPYSHHVVRNKRQGDTRRVVKGGSFRSTAALLHCAARLDQYPNYSFDDVGLRVVSSSITGRS